MTSRYQKTMAEALAEARGIITDAKYKYDGKVVFISKQEFKKISKDYKNATPGQERMVVLDPKTQATVSAPVKFTEDTDHEISMARGELEAISDKALKLSSILQGKTDEDQLEAWVQSKITKAKDYINSVADYMEYNPDNAMEGFSSQQIRMAYGVANDPRYKGGNYTGAVKAIEKIAKGLSDHPDVRKVLQRTNEDKQPIQWPSQPLEESFSDAQIAKLKKEYEPLRGKKISIDNANKLGAMFTKFDKDKNALEKLYGADIPFISTTAMTRLISKHGYTADKIKKIRKEELEYYMEELVEMYGNQQIDPTTAAALRKYLSGKAGGSPFPPIREGTGSIKGFRNDREKDNMISLAKQHGLKVKDVVGGIELSGNMRKILDMQLAAQGNGLKAEEVKPQENEEKPEMKPQKKEEGDDKEKQIADLKAQIDMLKQKLEIEKNATVKPEANPDTGEVPLKVGIAHKILADKAKKKQEVKESEEKDKAYAIGMSVAKKKMNDEPPLKKSTIKKGHEIADKILKKEESEVEETHTFTTNKMNQSQKAKLKFEEIAGLKKKAEKSGMPYSILKKVYDRGMAAWRGGHRPGATQQQWAFARVNSFVTKSSGTWGGADKDLAAKVKGE